MKKTIYYKLVRPDYRSFHDKTFQWPVRGLVEVSDAEPSGACGRGLHLAKNIQSGLQYARFPFRILKVMPRSPVLGEDNTRIRVAKAETLGELPRPSWVKTVEQRIATLPAEMNAIPWFKGTDDKRAVALLRSHFKLLVPFGFKLDWEIDVVHTREEAAAARAAARDAARAAARDAAWAAARDAGRKLPSNPFRPLWKVWKLGAWPIGFVGKTFKVYVAKGENTGRGGHNDKER